MYVFKSRKISREKFLEEFFETITPGVIPRRQFIDWTAIRKKCDAYSEDIIFFQTLVGEKKKKIQEEIRDTLLSSDEPLHLLKAGFELLGHTNQQYVSDEDNLDLPVVADLIRKGSAKEAAGYAKLLLDLGVDSILATTDIGGTFLGVQVGLESNRRKNVGGEVFRQWVKELVESTCSQLGAKFEVTEEERIQYKNSINSKRVDFAITHRGKPRIGIEANFYTVAGSKPTEIKRAYATVNRDLAEVGVELVWITDGSGYFKMRRSLGEAFMSHRNTYNYEMARRHLKEDLLTHFS